MTLPARLPMRRRTRLAASGAVGALMIAASADAQSGHRMMVMEDSGDGHVMQVSLPNMRALRSPDFVLADLPDFSEKLALAETQQPVVDDLLREYLAAFDLLRVELLPKGSRMFGGGPFMSGMGPDHADHGEDHGDNVFFFGDMGGGLHDIALEADRPGTFSIAITATGPGGGGFISEDVDSGGGPDGVSGSVVIEIGNEDGEISDEMREKLEEHAQQLVKQLQEQLAKAEANSDGLLGVNLEADMADHMIDMQDLVESAEKFEAAKADLKSKFVASVQSILEDEQLERWPMLDRTLTRKKTLQNGRINGERTDLLQVIDSLKIGFADNADVTEQLQAYEIALHEALVRRNAFVKDATKRVDEALQEQNTDKALSIVDRATQLRLAVKQINTTYATAITQHLDEEDATAFSDAVRKRSYPRVYRRTRGLRTFEAARKIDGLEEDTLMAILELEGAFRRELELVNDQIRRVIDEHQPKDSRRAIASMGDAMFGGGGHLSREDDPVRAAYKKRTELEARHVKLLENVLTPEQIEQLPKARVQGSMQPFILRRSTGSGSN